MKKNLFTKLFARLLLLNSCSEKNPPVHLENSLSTTDYSFGIPEITEIKTKIFNNRFVEGNELIKQLSSDKLSHTIDCLALNLNEETLSKWYSETNKSDPSCLALGVFYAHKGWKIRTNAYAIDVEENHALSFSEYQIKAALLLEAIKTNQSLKAEAYSRLIRISMGLGNSEEETAYFENCIKIDPNNVWAYIHRSESIQPKWGGSQDKINDFLMVLPKGKIQNIVHIKLILDSFISQENLLTGGDFEIIELEKRTLEMDRELIANPLNSPFSFLVNGYMTLIFQELGNETLSDKYFSKMDDNYTLYPFGIME